MSTIGTRMRILRGTSSLREMSDAIGIKYNAWSRYETGDVLPGAEIIERICRIHACSADWLLGLDEKPNNQSIAAIHPAAPSFNLTAGELPQCKKCPIKAKLDRLEKVLNG